MRCTALTASSTVRHRRQSTFNAQLRDAVAAIAKHRSAIEQAKRMPMFIYGIGAEDAFQLLSAQSQATNVKVRLIAERLTVDFLALTPEQRAPDRSALTRCCSGTHRRDHPSS
jgi:AmiR/NasT family two-component response regulator